MTKKTTIIVPVYGDWPSLRDCIKSLKENVDSKQADIIFINDCGPDVQEIEKNIQTAIKNRTGFAYYRNKKNLGFVGTCNYGVNKLDKTHNDVLLLNSDTKVTPGFLEEMTDILNDNKKVGAVSPRSNNATICTLPISAIKSKGIDKLKSYSLFMKHFNDFPRYTIAPTAHGFCMLIRRSLIEQYGLFDSVFGKGYGEEVDFCQRIKKHGYNSAISHRAYVFHLEAKSFSMPVKQKMLEQNNKIIESKYPLYKNEVTNYILNQTIEEERVLGNIKRNKYSTIRKAYQKIERLMSK